MSAQSVQAANSLSDPGQQGTLAYAYRRSIIALHSVFGGNSDAQYAEREPLLNQNNASNDPNAPSGCNTYGAVASCSSRCDSCPSRCDSCRPRIRKPNKLVSQSKVEAKVWFANERTWISWLRLSVLIGSFALALFNSDTFFKGDNGQHAGGGEKNGYLSSGSIKAFGAVYAGIAVLTLLWGLYNYQRRLTLIKTKHPGNFDDLIGPPLVCAALFLAVLLNFIIRVKQHDYQSHA